MLLARYTILRRGDKPPWASKNGHFGFAEEFEWMLE